MYHYDPNTALEELNEDATLPNPVHVRDMILRKKLTKQYHYRDIITKVAGGKPEIVKVISS